jgi:hypothetical protein
MIKLLCLAAVFYFQGAQPAPNAVAPASVTVTGRVIADEVTRTRVIRVSLISSGAGESQTTLVDSDGTFEISKVKPGSYTAIGFAATSVSEPFALSVGAADITDVQIRLPEAKSIRGRIVVQGDVPANVPIPRIAFTLAPVAGIPNSGANVPAVPQPDGSFTIGLPEGERRISVVAGTVPPGYKLSSFTYGTADLLKDPLRISAGAGAELRVTFDAGAITPVKVSGRVADLLTTQGVRVVLTHPVLGSIESTVAADGSFAFSKVMPGTYVARLSLSGLSTARQIAVADRDITDLVLTYPREFVVAGHIIVEGEPDASPSVVLEARETKAGGGSPRTALNANNVVMLNLKDGEYNIGLRIVRPGYVLKSMTYGTIDLQKAPLKIDGPVTWEIIVRLAPAAR